MNTSVYEVGPGSAVPVDSLKAAIREQQALATFERVLREAVEDAEETGWNTVAGGRAPGTYDGGTDVWLRPYHRISDRADGRFAPFYSQLFELERMRGKCRNLATYTSVAVGAMEALKVYCIGGEWEFDVGAKPDTGVEVPPDLIREVKVVMMAILESNSFINELDGELHNFAREDGEAPVALYARPDGTCDMRRLDADNITEPKNGDVIDRWLGQDYPRQQRREKPRTSWTFGVHTLFDERMQRIDHERHAGYHVSYDDGGVEWDYLPAWPTNIGDPELDGKALHLIKRNTPRGAKRGISDYWPILTDLQREDKLSENLSVGAAVMAAIPWIEELPKGTTRAEAQNSLSDNLDRFSKQLTYNRNQGERTVQRYKPGTVLKVLEGRKYHTGPIGESRSPIYIEVGQHLFRRIGIRWLMPEYMISGDASNANFASTLVAESPFVKAREAEQKFFVSHFRWIIWKALKIAVDRGRFARWRVVQQIGDLMRVLELKITPPMVATRDKAQQISELMECFDRGIMDANEVRTDLRREPIESLEGVTGGANLRAQEQQAQRQLAAQQQANLATLRQAGQEQQPGTPQARQDGPGQGQPSEQARQPVQRTGGRQEAFNAVSRFARNVAEARAMLRVTERSSCGANADGGGGFQSGNDCAGEGGGADDEDTLPSGPEKVEVPGSIAGDVKVYTNPSFNTAKAWLSKSKSGELRAVAEGNNLFIWDGHDAIHHQVAQAMNLGKVKKLLATDEKTLAALWKKAGRPVPTAESMDIPFSKLLREAKDDCGANAPGGGGFQAGNECAGEGGGGGSDPKTAGMAKQKAVFDLRSKLDKEKDPKKSAALKAQLEQAVTDLKTHNAKYGSTKAAPAGAKKSGKQKIAGPAPEAKRTDRGLVFKGENSADQFGNEHYSKWAGGLSEQHEAAVQAYTGTEYMAVNDHLRGFGDDEEAARLVKHLDAAIKKAPPAPDDLVVYRGVARLDDAELDFKVGQTFTDKAYMSTSMNRDVAQGFLDGDKTALLEIKVPKGTRGAYVDMVSDHDNEQEFLLPRATKLKIVAIKGKGSKAVIQAEVVQ